MAARILGRDLPASRIHCLYHYPCHDGVFAALALQQYYSKCNVPVVWVPHTTFKPLAPSSLGIKSDDLVYLLDFSGPPGFVDALAAQHPKRVIVLDHHKTAAADLARPEIRGLEGVEILFDMHRSGAMISHDYFQPLDLPPRVTAVYEFVQDADLWTWKLPGSRAFHAGLAAAGMEYDPNLNRSLWSDLLAIDPEEVRRAGEARLAAQEGRVQAALAGAIPVRLGPADGPLGAAQGLATVLDDGDGEGRSVRSVLGNALAAAAGGRAAPFLPVGVVAYREEGMAGHSLKLSLRSRGGVDVSGLAAALGGGGHAAAASAVVPAADFQAQWVGLAQGPST
uniref:DHHA1 domain-containing protein n=1 Tax=Auxenochlorella protothecoides TaxID=3075 RepID=A0A1D1ZSY5_AUXPR